MAEIVRGAVPNTIIEYAPGGEPDKRSYRVDFGKVRRMLPEWQPQWTARQGAAQLRDVYRRVGITLEDFEGPRFRRIDLLKRMMSEGRVDTTLRWVER